MADRIVEHRGFDAARTARPAESVTMSNFVKPETERLEIGGGDYIVVKKRLNVREARRVMARQMKPMAIGERPQLDYEQVGLAQVSVYLLEWGGPGFTENGKTVPYTEAALDDLDPDVFARLFKAVQGHIENEERAEKNSASETASPAISPSAA